MDLTSSAFIFGKAFVLVGFTVYVIFAGVVVRQIYLMTRTFSIGGLEFFLKTVAWVHLAVAVLVLLFALTFL